MRAYVKDYWKRKKIPDAPKPTKPVKVDKPLGITEYELLPQKEREKKQRIAREHSTEAREDSWTRDEEETLVRMFKRGYSKEQIAGCLPRRTVGAVDTKLRRMRKKGEI